MTDAPDTTAERLADYQRIFRALIGRERTDDGIRFRFRTAAGLEDQVRDLAARDKACCAFFTFAITATEPCNPPPPPSSASPQPKQPPPASPEDVGSFIECWVALGRGINDH